MRTTTSKKTSFGMTALLFGLLLGFVVGGQPISGAPPVQDGDHRKDSSFVDDEQPTPKAISKIQAPQVAIVSGRLEDGHLSTISQSARSKESGATIVLAERNTAKPPVGATSGSGGFSLNVSDDGTTCGNPPQRARTCSATGSINCGGTVNGDTSLYADTIDLYTCSTWDESGPEAVFTITPTVDSHVTATLSNLHNNDLDVFILTGPCANNTCVASGNTSATVDVTAGTTYSIVVDGFQGAAGPFTLTVTCTPVAPLGACCVANTCTGTKPEADCRAESGVWFDGKDCASFACPLPPTCPSNTLYGQVPPLPNETWSLGVSDTDWIFNTYTGALRYESFPTLTAPICDVHWWGVNYGSSNGLCVENLVTFDIKFYDNAAASSTPGAEVCAYTVSTMGTPTGWGYLYPNDLNAYQVALPTCCPISSGWVSIQATGGPDCWFWWLNSPNGDGKSCFQDGRGLDCSGTSVDTSDDLSICLTGATVPLGACCLDGRCLGLTTAAQCEIQSGTWQVNGDCTTVTCPPPTNNTCSSATDISGTIIGDNTGTSTTVSASCTDSQNDVWYRYTPTCSGVLVISTCGTQGTLADTVLSVYDACGGRELACNDDGGGSCGTRAKIEMPVTAGKPILIRVADYGTGTPDQGTFPLDISERIAPVRVSPPGFYVTPGDGPLDDHLVRLDTESNTVVDIGPLGISSVWGLAFDSNLGIMFGVSPITDQLVTVDLATGAATPVGSFVFDWVVTLGFDVSSNGLYGVDEFAGAAILLAIDPVSGAATSLGDLTGIFPEALTFDPASGQLYATITKLLGTPGNLVTIDPSSVLVTTVGSFGGDFDIVEGLAFDAATGVLYGTQNDSTSFDGRLMRVDKATGVATQVGGAYLNLAPGGFEIIPGLPDGTLGQPYTGRIPVTGGCPPYGLANVSGLPAGLSTNGHDTILGTPTETGDFTITFDVGDTNFSTSSIGASLPLRVRPANDDCAAALSAPEGDTPFTTLGASTDGPVEQALCTFSGDPRVQHDVWFCHQATCTGQLTASVCGSDYDTKLAVYNGCTCPTGPSAVACNDDSCGLSGLQSEVTMSVTSGQSYLIRVGGFSGSTGTGTLSISCVECTLDTDCNDGDLCTDDVCVNGTCRFNSKTCDDGNLCTTDACAPATGCSNTPIRCDDQNACTTEACNLATGICDVTLISCDDSNLCTTDSCDPALGCAHTPVVCDDGDACTDDACDGPTGQCVTSPTSCDDLNPCSIDTCDPATGCTHTFGGQPNADCNTNGTDDACDIFSGTSLDCNANGIPDECDIRIGAEYHPLDFSAYHNDNLQSIDSGFPSGNVVLGGVPFDIPTAPTNIWHSAAETGSNPRVIDIPVNRFGVGEVHTLINNYWGQPGPTAYAWLEFFGSNGAYYRKDLIGNEDIRDFNQLFYTNNINGTTTTNVVMVGSHRLDKQTIALPADFLHETLLQIKVSDNGGDNFQRIFLAGITTLVGGSLDCNANQVPDECDIAEGVSLDLDGNTVPDECEHCGWIEWPISAGGNGHYYLPVYTPAGISWDNASLAAAAAGGYLVSIHSSAENDFVFNLIDAPRFWAGPVSGYYEGPWLGGFQPTGSAEPAGGWTWESGEPWTYANWGPAQPDNHLGAQNWTAFFAPPGGATRTNLWDDAGLDYQAYGYVIETDDAHAISDCDGDGDVDELDYRCFVQCLTGPGGGLLTDCCRYDYDRDLDVDTEDFSVFQNVYQKMNRSGCAVPPPGLIGWWPGDGNANDIIGTNNASTQNGATYGPGFVNQAFSFDGIDDSVVTSLPVGITGNAPRTLCAWIKSANTYPATCCPTPFSFGTTMFGGTFGNFISNGIWWFWGYWDDVNTQVNTDTNWNLHCLTYDSTNVVYYLNRDAIASQLKSLSTVSSPLVIGDGIDPARTDTFFNGLVDEVQLYNRALSTQEVKALYDAGPAGACRP